MLLYAYLLETVFYMTYSFRLLILNIKGARNTAEHKSCFSTYSNLVQSQFQSHFAFRNDNNDINGQQC